MQKQRIRRYARNNPRTVCGGMRPAPFFCRDRHLAVRAPHRRIDAFDI